MEEPHARVISHKTDTKIALRRQHERVSFGRKLGKGIMVAWVVWDRITIHVVIEMCPIRGGSGEKLKVVPVEMEWMGTSITVVEDNHHNLIMTQKAKTIGCVYSP